MTLREREKHFVYINTFAAHFATEGFMKRYLDKKLGKQWFSMSDVLIPMALETGKLGSEFFHGVATAQFSSIQLGGTFINPMIAGFKTDFDTWNGIVHSRPDFAQNVMYLDIPYSLYKVVEESEGSAEDCVTEEEYQENSTNMQKLVRDLSDQYYVSNKVQH